MLGEGRQLVAKGLLIGLVDDELANRDMLIDRDAEADVFSRFTLSTNDPHHGLVASKPATMGLKLPLLAGFIAIVA